MGYTDFSGSGVIHLYSGACGFVATWVIGPRTGRFQGDDSRRQGDPIPAHSLPVIFLSIFKLTLILLLLLPRNPLGLIFKNDHYNIVRQHWCHVADFWLRRIQRRVSIDN